MIMRVVAPDIEMSSIETGKYGNYIDITNPNRYDLDISDWKIVLNDTLYSFPRNTILLQGVTRIPLTMKGFASTTIASSTLIKILFPTMEEVLRVQQRSNLTTVAHVPMTTTATTSMASLLVTRKANAPNSSNLQKSNGVVVDKATSSKILVPVTKKDTRIASLMRSLFGK